VKTINNPRWHGISENWLLHSATPIEAWDDFLKPIIAEFGFNTVRLTACFANSPHSPDRVPLDYTTLDSLLDFFAGKRINVIIDACHNWGDLLGYLGSPAWFEAWLDLVSHFLNDKRIAAWELFNEPAEENWYSTVTTKEEVLSKALNPLADQIAQLGDTHLIIYPSPWYYNWKYPYIPGTRNIVLSYHCWEWRKTTVMSEALAYAQDFIKGLAAWNNTFPMIVGETGLYNGSGDLLLCQIAFEKEIINACVDLGVGFIMHAWTHQHGAVGSYQEALRQSKYIPPTPRKYIFKHWQDGDINPTKKIIV
jgi:hypothetical protein